MEKDALWVKVLNSKYCSYRRLNAKNCDKLPCSRTWKAMKMGGEVFNKGIRWIPGRNSSLNLWHDKWMPNGRLRDLIQGPLTVEDESLKVKDVFGLHGWDWSVLSFQLPNNILMEVNSIPYSVRAIQGEDRLIWSGANRGNFDLNHAYALAMGNESDAGPFNGMWVWKLDTIPRVKTFMWQCLHNAIRVGECLVKQCISNDDIYPLCHREPETILHRLRDYGTLKQIWERLGVRQNNNFYEGNLGQWLEYKCKNNTHRLGEQPPWRIIFPFAIWLLWKH